MEKAYYNSPIGTLEISGKENAITSIYFVSPNETTGHILLPVLQKCIEQLDEYFKGSRKEFHLDLEPEGSPFRKSVWSKLLQIPYGGTCSYMDLAVKLGSRDLVRAVGTANGKNPISIVIPCHRVIGSDGKLTGYAGGFEKKKWLLEHEWVNQ